MPSPLRWALSVVLGCAALLLSPAWSRGQSPYYIPIGQEPGSSYQLIFVTSFLTAITGDQSFPPSPPLFGNRTDADWLVTSAAYNGGLLTNWDGASIVWKALLSDDPGTPQANAKDYVPITAPLYNTHGDLIASSAAQLWSGSIDNPVLYDETGTAVTSYPPENRSDVVWTGTRPNGTATDNTCNNWNTIGTSASAEIGDCTCITYAGNTNAWIDQSVQTANMAGRLYGVSPVFAVGPAIRGQWAANGSGTWTGRATGRVATFPV